MRALRGAPLWAALVSIVLVAPTVLAGGASDPQGDELLDVNLPFTNVQLPASTFGCAASAIDVVHFAADVDAGVLTLSLSVADAFAPPSCRASALESTWRSHEIRFTSQTGRELVAVSGDRCDGGRADCVTLFANGKWLTIKPTASWDESTWRVALPLAGSDAFGKPYDLRGIAFAGEAATRESATIAGAPRPIHFSDAASLGTISW